MSKVTLDPQPVDLTGETDTDYVSRLPVGEVRELFILMNVNHNDSEAAETWFDEYFHNEMFSVLTEEELIAHELETF